MLWRSALPSMLVGMVVPAKANTLTTVIQSKETAISVMASQAQNAFYNRCSDRNSCGTTSTSMPCSVPACGSEFPSSKGFQCTGAWGVDAGTCGSATQLVRSVNTSAVRFAVGTDFTSFETQAFVCSSTRMDPTFIQANTAGSLKAWQYTSDTLGSIRLWPGAPQGRGSTQCNNYDPRLRPWFIAASSGPKDIIMIFDTSGSMLTSTAFGTRHSLVQNALVALLGTLTTNDWVSLIQFSDSATVLGGHTTLQAATAEHVTDLQNRVKAAGASGGTSFLPPFRKAFQLFSDTTESSRCTKIILFLTDGVATDGASTVVEIQSLRATVTGRVHIFTYAMSSSADTVVPKAVACDNDGVFATINDGTDPLTEMQSYFRFIATGLDSDTVRWTTPYEDAFGLGQMVTGARAVYDRRDASNPLLVGVVGADVTMSELEQYADFRTVVGELVARGSGCPTISLTDCQMQKLRERESSASVCPAPAPVTSTCTQSADSVEATPCTGSSSNLNNMLCTSLNSVSLMQSSGSQSLSTVMCCSESGNPISEVNSTSRGTSSSSNAGLIAGIVIGIIVGIAFIAIVVYLVVVKPAAEANKTSSSPPAQNQLHVPTPHQPPPVPSHYSPGYRPPTTAHFYV